MRAEVKKLLFDVHQAASGLVLMLEGKSLEQFREDRILQLAVERQFEIIGEAFYRLRKVEPGVLEGFPEHVAIVGLRNVIAHGYDAIDYERLMDIARNDVPVLVEKAAKALVG